MTQQALLYEALKNIDDNIVRIVGFKTVTPTGHLQVLPLTIQMDNNDTSIVFKNDILNGIMTVESTQYPGSTELNKSLNKMLYMTLEELYGGIIFSRRYDEIKGYTLSCVDM